MLEVEDAHTDYGRSHVLQGVSLTIPDRAAIVVLGRNGVARPRSCTRSSASTAPRGNHPLPRRDAGRPLRGADRTVDESVPRGAAGARRGRGRGEVLGDGDLDHGRAVRR
jgi:hypothetical protein